MRFAFTCKPEKPQQRAGKRVAVIGAGPSGLAATGLLACKGYDVTVYERLPLPGGLMLFGIPSARIPPDRVLAGCKELKEVYGVDIRTSTKVAAGGDRLLGDDLVKETVGLQDVVDGNDATIIASGTWNSRGLPAGGTNNKGIFSALEFLFRSKAHELGLIPEAEKLKLGKRVAVIGSGLVAVDAALEAHMEGHEVVMISIENQFDAPSGSYEMGKLIGRGVQHVPRTVTKNVLGDGKVQSMELIKVNADVKNGVVLKMEQIPGSETILENIDNIIVGIGQIPTPPFGKEYTEIKTLRWGGIEVNAQHMSSKGKVYATGDVATGITKVGRAFQTGLKTASWVDRVLTGRS